MINWLRHLNRLHYQKDLGNIVDIHKFWWGEVLIRECSICRRRFADFSSGL